MNFIWMTLIAIVIFIVVDAFWLGLVAPKFYKKHLGHLMAEKPNFIAAGIFYLVYILGTVYLIILPAVNANSIGTAFLTGAIFGFVAYATYDLTNLATLKNWSIKVTVVDLIWGTFLSSFIAGMTSLIFISLF